MKSTRSSLSVSSSEAILTGLSPDGGLFVLDSVDIETFASIPFHSDYRTYATAVMQRLLPDMAANDLETIVSNAYSNESFPRGVVGISTLPNTAILELFHGPTFAFKDMALSVLPHLFDTAKRNLGMTKPTVILTATSGDTGGAALSGFQHLENTYVIVLYPKQGVSPLQEQQMNSFQSDRCLILGIDGNFDDCQSIVKDLLQHHRPDHVLMSSANSINIGRIIPQIVYYLYGYHHLVQQEKIHKNDPINIVVPTGNFGNIYAAYLAKQMGLPVHKLIIASNKNNVLTDAFTTGKYRIRRALYQTISPSMDIVVSSNLERYLYHLANHDSETCLTWMNELRTTGQITIPNINPKQTFYAGWASEAETKTEIRTVWDEHATLIDPHTAVASRVLGEYRKITNDQTYSMIVSTASPYKFVDTMAEALGLNPGSSIKQTIGLVEQHTNVKADNRLHDLLNRDVKTIELSIRAASKYVTDWIGDLR